MNENGNEKCSMLLFVANLILVFGACFHLPFIAFCCSSLRILVFEIESVLSKWKPGLSEKKYSIIRNNYCLVLKFEIFRNHLIFHLITVVALHIGLMASYFNLLSSFIKPLKYT